MLFGHIRGNALHLKLVGGAVCQMKRKGVYAWETVHFDRICECVCRCVRSSVVWRSMMWLFVFVDELVFICMCLLMAGSLPGLAHLLASPNQWHHRYSMTRLFLIAAAITAVTVEMRRQLSYTHIQAFSWSIWPSWLLDIMDVKMLIVTPVVLVGEGFKSIGIKWCVK